MNEWFILKVTRFQGITEVQNKIQCNKKTKQSNTSNNNYQYGQLV